MFTNFTTLQDTKKKFKKNDFAEHCSILVVDGFDGFDGFKKLFDLIKTIKGV